MDGADDAFAAALEAALAAAVSASLLPSLEYILGLYSPINNSITKKYLLY